MNRVAQLNRKVKRFFFVLLLGSCLSCNIKSGNDSKEIAEKENKEKFAGGTSEKEAQLYVDIALSNLYVTRLLELAGEKSNTPCVVQVSKTLERNHEKTADELTAIAADRSISLPNTLDQKRKEELSSMKNTPDDEFDKKMFVKLKDELNGTLSLMEKASSVSKDEEYREWLDQKKTMLRSHLVMIGNCRAISEN